MYSLYEDAAAFLVGETPVYLYGAALALGAFLALLTLLARQKRLTLPDGTALCLTALALPLGIFFARLLYCLLDTNFQPIASLKNALMLNAGGYSMAGALLGACAAAVLTAQIMRVKFSSLLDAFVPALLLFIAFERAGEAFTAIGYSRPLTDDALKSTFLAQTDEYDAYLRTWLLESLAALILLPVSLRMKSEKAGDTALKTALLFSSLQVIFESLRYDQHLKYGFVGVQHILSMLLMAVIVIVFAVRVLKTGEHRGLAITAICILPAVAAALVGIEFMIDRTSISHYLLYFVYALLLVLPTVMGFMLCKKGEEQ